MSRLDKLISKFFNNLRQGRKDAFTKQLMSDPKARDAVKRLKKAEKDLLDTIKNKNLIDK